MRKTLILAISALLGSCAAAIAETRATTAPPAPAAPPAPTATTFGQWTLRCGVDPGSGERACEVDSAIVLPGQTGPIAQVAFGRLVKQAEKQAKNQQAPDKTADNDKPADKATPDKDAKSEEKTTRLIILVPVNVTIAPGVEVVADAAKPHLNIPFKTCIQAACFAQLELTAEQMQAFRGQTKPGQITFTDPSGKPVPVELSFKGLDQALDALAKR
ncbi:invasion associated locus B family protein [Methylocella tundrae]|nr:invasion associated locus B family protein [Methylocella tundrae]